MKQPESPIARFARHVLGKPLYPYQCEVAEAILDSIEGQHGRIITVMMARQSGKNQLSAVLEAYLLMTRAQGTIVKAAPTFTPQVVNSRLRLLSMLDTPLTRERIWTSHGYIVGLAPRPESSLLRNHTGPRVMFYSAGQESNVVGATADILLEIDEAQDVTPEKFNRDFRPMAATSNSTTILYGTAWSDSTLLAQQRATNLEQEQQSGLRTHFEYDWRVLAAINPRYRAFVEQEIARLGEDHPAIQTQYFLHSLSGAGYLLSSLQHALLQGTHLWEETPGADGWYIAGMDVAGEERPAPGLATGDSFARPGAGRSHLEQYAAVLTLVEQWSIRSLVIDATGLGAGLASLLLSKFGPDRIVPFTFSRPAKSRLAYQLVALLNAGRLKLYAPQQAPTGVYNECWQQLRRARYRLPAPETLDFYVDPADGHDDFLISLALLAEASQSATLPATSTLIRPMRLYHEEGRY